MRAQTEAFSVTEAEKKRPHSGPSFSKRPSGGYQRKVNLTPLRESGTDRVGSRTLRVKFSNGAASSVTKQLSICRTKLASQHKSGVPFWEPVQNQEVRVNTLDS